MRMLRRLFSKPFADGRGQLIVHCCHHKVGTVWFRNMLDAVGREYGLAFATVHPGVGPGNARILLDSHSRTDIASFDANLRGSHMIRDPRDVVVSGYHYHLWTTEEWANKPVSRLGGDIAERWSLLPVQSIGDMSYREYLNSLPREEGMLVEIRRAATTSIRDMRAWNYRDPRFLEIRYEEIIRDEEATFRTLFRHYGFTEAAVERSVELAMRFSLSRRPKTVAPVVQEKSHRRSGKPQQWASEFTDRHKDLFKQLLGQDLIALGYETSLDW